MLGFYDGISLHQVALLIQALPTIQHELYLKTLNVCTYLVYNCLGYPRHF
jgi:hypothetical protein